MKRRYAAFLFLHKFTLNTAEEFMNGKLSERKVMGNYRELKADNTLTDFCSNDYLGFARSAKLKLLIEEELSHYPDYKSGATGSRLISGNLNYTENLEKEIASFHGSEAALIFNAGYDANIGLFSALPQRGDTLITDELIHASIIDGARLSYANRYTFKHNDMQSLEEKLKHAKGRIYLVVESVYSMDGDMPPMDQIIALSEKYHANVIVDEAHALGFYQKGLINEINLENKVFARIITFGKALGCHGAAILGSQLLRNYLVNFARSFIYTTAAPFHAVASVRIAYQNLSGAVEEIEKLHKNINFFKKYVNAGEALIKSDTQIQGILIADACKTRQIALSLQNNGLDVRPILSPTVPEGTERLRICLHSFNTQTEIQLLTEKINSFINVW
jgi:8-amino-7-oxononanoate synthase